MKKIPENLLYSDDHEWVRVEGPVLVVGITDYAQDQLGDIVFVEIDPEATSNVFGTIEAVKTVSDLLLPVNGDVIEVNENIDDEPELINNDPYGEGWIIKMTPDDDKQLDSLMTPEQYKKFCDE